MELDCVTPNSTSSRYRMSMPSRPTFSNGAMIGLDNSISAGLLIRDERSQWVAHCALHRRKRRGAYNQPQPDRVDVRRVADRGLDWHCDNRPGVVDRLGCGLIAASR
jgi:hypothetical protein